ncbi:MAG TPA: translation initiation factor [Bacteroidales bacterium]|jgi:translation initiation factor 1|nr:translation initiation factor [Bacteroidales bacterium]HOU98815.1 translation initiation factor [Bacteroidales bacterium]
MSKNKNKIDIVYSTNPDFQYNYENAEENIETLAPGKQKLYISLDKKNRNGKIVTIVSNFIGKQDDLSLLEKTLKTKCGTGGSNKDGEIIIQGDFRDKIEKILNELGYKTIRKG